MINRYVIDKVGTQKVVTTRYGDKKTVGIIFRGVEGWHNGFVPDDFSAQEGETLECELYEKGGYKNFKLPGKKEQDTIRLAELEDRINKMARAMKVIIQEFPEIATKIKEALK